MWCALFIYFLRHLFDEKMIQNAYENGRYIVYKMYRAFDYNAVYMFGKNPSTDILESCIVFVDSLVWIFHGIFFGGSPTFWLIKPTEKGRTFKYWLSSFWNHLICSFCGYNAKKAAIPQCQNPFAYLKLVENIERKKGRRFGESKHIKNKNRY